jgi:universal stress protein E
MFKKVLVLADGDDPNHPALRRALSLVAEEGEIVILAVAYEPMLDAYLGNKEIHGPLRRRVLEERQARAAELARAVETEGVRASAKAIWAHPMHAAVASEVLTQGYDLVVAAPANLHGSGPAARGGLTHSDWQVVVSCPAPLLVVTGDGRAQYRNIVAAVDPLHSHAKPEDLDAQVLRYAKLLQIQTRASVAVVHCHAPLDYFGADLTYVPARSPGAVDVRLAAVRALCTAAGMPEEAARLTPGVPHEVLYSLQGRGEADLIVMGALARGRLAEIVLGSTAERVLHRGRGDVLVVKAAAKR